MTYTTLVLAKRCPEHALTLGPAGMEKIKISPHIALSAKRTVRTLCWLVFSIAIVVVRISVRIGANRIVSIGSIREYAK